MLKSSSVIWLIGLSGAGKSTLANGLRKKFSEAQIEVEILDGDVMRARTNATGFSRSERLKHLQSMADLAGKISADGKVVIGAFITPYEEAREYLRKTCPGYIEIWVATPLEECERRDVKGLYAKARRGEIRHFTGVDDPFERPASADFLLMTDEPVTESIERLWIFLKGKI